MSRFGIHQLRLRYFITQYSRAVAASAALVIAVTIVLVATPIVTPATPVSPLATSDEATGPPAQTIALDQSVHVTVMGNETPYDPGEELTNEPLYPQTGIGEPRIQATVDPRETQPRAVTIRVRHEAAPRTATENTFYQTERTLVTETNLTASDTTTVNASLPLSQVLATQSDLEDAFGDDVIVRSYLESTVQYQYTGADQTTQRRTLTVGGQLRQTDALIDIPNGADQQTHGITATGTTPTESVHPLNGAAAGLGALSGLALVLVWRNRATNLRELTTLIQRREYRNWITDVDSYTPQGNKNVVQVSSLEGLINFAIDTNQRVLYHRDVEEYIVVTNTSLFKYKPESDNGRQTELFGMNPEKVDLSVGPKLAPDIQADGGTDADTTVGAGTPQEDTHDASTPNPERDDPFVTPEMEDPEPPQAPPDSGQDDDT